MKPSEATLQPIAHDDFQTQWAKFDRQRAAIASLTDKVYVAVYDGELLDSDNDLESLYERVKERLKTRAIVPGPIERSIDTS